MDDNVGTGNDPQRQAGQGDFFGQGEGFGQQPQRPQQPQEPQQQPQQPYGHGQTRFDPQTGTYTHQSSAQQQNPYGSQGQYGSQGEYGSQGQYASQGQYGGQNPYASQSAYSSQQNTGFPQPAGTPTSSGQPTTHTQPKRRGRAGLMVLSLALAAVIGGGVGVGSYSLLSHRDGQSIASPITVTTQQAKQQAKTDGTVEAATKAIEPSVVTITVQSGSSGDIGSGVVLDKKGHILTNNHVVAADDTSEQGGFPGSQTGQQSGAEKITVTFKNGKTAQAKVVGTDETDDLAVIKVDGVSDLKPAKFAKSSSLSVGQSVVAVGAPLGLSQTATSGIVSNTARPVRSGTNNDAVYMAVQTDAAINPGNSGGPLVDLNGSVIGIDSSIASTSETGSGDSQSGNIGIGFAIPSNVAVRVASELIANGKSADAVLGVTIIGSENGALGSTTAGVPLQSVEAGSGAAKAGLKAGDVVTALNGFKVTTADGLIAATHYYAPGTTVKVTYQRDGHSKTVQATLGSA